MVVTYEVTKVYTRDDREVELDIRNVDSNDVMCVSVGNIKVGMYKFTNATIISSGVVQVAPSVPREALNRPLLDRWAGFNIE